MLEDSSIHLLLKHLPSARLPILILDLDGTLLNNQRRHYLTYREALTRFHGPPLTPIQYWNLKRRATSGRDILARSGAARLIRSFHRDFVRLIEQRHRLSIDRPFPGATPFLRWASKQFDLHLVTARHHRLNVLWQLRRWDWNQYFRNIHTVSPRLGQVSKAKIQVAIGLQRTKVGIAAVAGDTEADMAMGRSLHTLSIGLLHGIRQRRLLTAAGANRLAPDLPSLKRILTAWLRLHSLKSTVR